MKIQLSSVQINFPQQIITNKSYLKIGYGTIIFLIKTGEISLTSHRIGGSIGIATSIPRMSMNGT